MLSLRTLPLTLLLFILTGCDDPQNNGMDTAQSPAQQLLYEVPAQEAGSFVAHLGLSAYTGMSMATQAAQELDSRLQSFLYHPNPMSLAEARNAWRDAYSAFLQTLIFSRLPVSDPPDWYKQGIDYKHTLTLLDSWPIEGGYVDHVPGYPFSGIVNDLTLELNEATLLAQHGFSDPSYASLGYHVFEFMLWGADGQRSAEDFFPQENTAPVVIPSEGHAGQSQNEASQENISQESIDEMADTAYGDNEPDNGNLQIQNHNRRRQFIQLLSDQLQKHLHRLQRRWEPSNGYYATLLQRTDPLQVLAVTFNATQTLLSDELLGKRLNGDSSQFSHSSIADIRAIVLGIHQLYLPDSDTEAGVGIETLLPENEQESILTLWKQQFALLDETLNQWQAQSKESEDMRQQSRERIIELMSVLKRTADALRIPLKAD